MSRGKLRPNKANEFLLDVVPTLDGLAFTVYDISLYLPHHEGMDRNRRLEGVDHEIIGKEYSVYIIDAHGLFSRQNAISFAGRFINGDGDYYRLD
jgi:hypothetical protein